MNDPNQTTIREIRGVRSVLFVCLGNICRSPLAQGVFEDLASKRGVRDQLVIGSCGTGGWHVGSPPDPRSVEVAGRNGVVLRSTGRQLDPATDFSRYELILAMNRKNLRDVLQAGCPEGRASLFLSFVPTSHRHAAERVGMEVPDPYYGGPEGFDHVFGLVHAGATGLLDAMFGEV